ncbi:MAG: type II toxin-antitoxin system RelE/ParE family toxin [Epsilonproteobacteria bacterium]|nr:type II toxin-antitoxin system RelE/ParE family toxin [Campylobacterota bacterium]
MKQLSFHPDVAVDIKGSFDWYEKELNGLGYAFISELENAYEAILHSPLVWANFEYGFKRYLLSRFPFSVVYKVTKETIFIIAVMHNSRNPNYWVERIEE